MRKFIHKISFVCFLLLVACVHRNGPVVGDTMTLAGLQTMGNTAVQKSRKKQKISRIREAGLQEIALSLGAQAGLAWRAKRINQELLRQARSLDTIYDFNSLILEHNILPPVLAEGRNTLNLADLQTIRISDRTYKVLKQARFITTPPNWREYLWMDFKAPEYPHVSLLPKNNIERQIWGVFIKRGWRQGSEQANAIIDESIARIREDFMGMILYRKLLAMNIISPPFVSHTDLGVTGDENEIHVDDRVLRITALPALNVDSKEWHAAVAKDDNSLEQFKQMEKLALNAKIVITSKAWQPVIAPINKSKDDA